MRKLIDGLVKMFSLFLLFVRNGVFSVIRNKNSKIVFMLCIGFSMMLVNIIFRVCVVIGILFRNGMEIGGIRLSVVINVV